MIQIRRARIQDASALADAERRIAAVPGFLVSRPHELMNEVFEKKIEALSDAPNGVYIVATGNEQIVGHALLDPMGLAAIAHVVRLTIAVHHGYEEKGIGETMLTHLIDWAKAAPRVEKIELNVRAVNLRAIRLYQKLGFNIEGRIRNRISLPDSSFIDDLEMGLFVKRKIECPTVVGLAVGTVVSSRSEVVDDDWDKVETHVLLDQTRFKNEALAELDFFSHAEIIFFMDQVDVRKIETGARHPRGNPSWPKAGIFAQRAKNRPNQIGSTICRIKKIDGLKLHLEGLDAVDGTPVLDIKPWMKEFGPRGTLAQPKWSTELMMGYWDTKSSSLWKPPTLTTDRLILRPIELSDADAIFAYAKNPNVCRFTIWEAHQSVQDSIDYIKNYIFGYYSKEVPEPFGIGLKENPQKIIGTVGSFWVSKPAKCMELAYAIAEDQWGKGLVAEASTAVIDFCHRELGIKRIQARCKSENEASAKVMQKIGMSFEGTLKSSLFHRDRYWDMHYYAKVFDQ